jgi:hypothetical protein
MHMFEYFFCHCFSCGNLSRGQFDYCVLQCITLSELYAPVQHHGRALSGTTSRQSCLPTSLMYVKKRFSDS